MKTGVRLAEKAALNYNAAPFDVRHFLSLD